MPERIADTAKKATAFHALHAGSTLRTLTAIAALRRGMVD